MPGRIDGTREAQTLNPDPTWALNRLDGLKHRVQAYMGASTDPSPSPHGPSMVLLAQLMSPIRIAHPPPNSHPESTPSNLPASFILPTAMRSHCKGQAPSLVQVSNSAGRRRPHQQWGDHTKQTFTCMPGPAFTPSGIFSLNRQASSPSWGTPDPCTPWSAVPLCSTY